MWESHVEKVLETDVYTSPIFLGALALDELNNKPKKPSCFIVNTEPRNKPGQHWLAVHVNKQGHASFFDSYGKHPKFYNLNSYFKNFKSYSFNKFCIQGDSNYCGYYCVLYLLFKCRKKEKLFFKLFNKNTTLNDYNMKLLINNKFFF